MNTKEQIKQAVEELKAAREKHTEQLNKAIELHQAQRQEQEG